MRDIQLLLPPSHNKIMEISGCDYPKIDIDFNKTLIKDRSHIFDISVNGNLCDSTLYSLSIKQRAYYDVDTFKFLDSFDKRVLDHNSKVRTSKIGLEDIFNPEGNSKEVRTSKITRINDDLVTYWFIFEDIEELLEFIRYYDNLDSSYNILDDYYHLIFARDRKNYSKYLKTKHWEKKRKAALKKANYKCQLCSSKDLKLEVHHNNYNNIGNEKDEDLIVLCERCHSRHHGK